MTQNEQALAFQDEVHNLVCRYLSEFDLSPVEMVMRLQWYAIFLTLEMLEQSTDDEGWKATST